MTNQSTTPLSDQPIYVEIFVYRNSEWARTFSFADKDTREFRDITDISFYGSVSFEGDIVGSFVFDKISDEEFSITLPVSVINSLDSEKIYDYDWFLVEGGIPEVFAKSKLQKFETVTNIP